METVIQVSCISAFTVMLKIIANNSITTVSLKASVNNF
jgi:hypothetical protein